MRAPTVTAVTTVTVAPATGGTMFGITNAHLVQSLSSGPASTGTIGLPPIKADSPTGPLQLTSSGGTGRAKVNRASSVCGPGPGMMLVSSLKASSRSGTSSPVKRNSSSSSSFGSSSDRRSVFYTDTEPEQSSKTQTSKQYDGMVNDESCSASEIYTLAPVTTTSGSDVDEVKQPRQDRRKMAPGSGNGTAGGVRAEELLRRLGNGQVRSKQQRPSGTGLEGVIGPKAHLKLVSQELEWERKLRDDQLSRILKALIGFENRLKNEQNRIRQQLYEKDDVINRQNCTINRMKRKLAAEEEPGTTDGGVEDGKKKAEEEEECGGRDDGDEVTQYCPKCRKNYYRLEYRTNGTQTFDYCRDDGAESVNTENLSLNSVEYASSSEEQESSLYVRANSFKDARRSRKYTSKRSYQGYQRGPSRASSFKSNASGQTTGTLTRLTERNERASPLRFDGQQREDDEDDEQPEPPVVESGHEAYVNIEPAMPKIAIYENYESDKENKRLDQNRRPECNNYDNVEPYSNRIDSLHGINRNGDGGDGGNHRKHYIRNEAPAADGLGGCSEQMELDDGTIFYEANTGGGGGSVGNNQQKYTEGMEMKQTIETNDDWYASASDMEDSDTALGKPYSNAAVNPVLECVNQILLQQSMDGFGDSNNNKDNTPGGDGAAEDEEELYIRAQEPSVPAATAQGPPQKEHPQTTVRSKRVHFSTQNSMVQVPRISLQSSLSNGGSRKDDKLSPTYEIQSIYSNEYEPIGSEHNSYSNYYVDMESKLGSEDRERELALAEKRKTPPALPPKPANLLKLQQLSKSNNSQHQPQQRQSTPQGAKMTSPRSPSSVAHSDITESEPDYCSISEIQDSVKCVQIVAEIHKDACEDDYSIVGEEEDSALVRAGSKQTSTAELLEESFEDVPKLPNVAEIVPPVKKEPLNKYISQDNYITKSISSVSSTNSGGSGAGKLASNGVAGGTVGVSAGASSVLGTPSKKEGEFREQLSEIIAEINKQSPAIRNASKKQVPVKELGSPFRGVSQIPSVTFQSKLKPVDKLSFLSKVPGSGARLPSTHHTPKLSTSIGRPAALKPTLLKSSLSQKALSSTNLSLGSPFGSPSKSSVSYIPNLKPSSVASSGAAGGGTGSPAKTSSSPKKATNGTSNGSATGIGVVSSTTNAQLSPTSPPSVTAAAGVASPQPPPPPPVIIAEDSKLPIQAEFDWYNLDAEYGKSSQPDVIVEADTVSNPEQETTGTELDTAMECRKLQNAAIGSAKSDDLLLNGNAAGTSNPENQSNGCGVAEEEQEEELENVEYNLDEEYKSVAPMVPPPDIIQKSSVHTPPITPPKSGKIPYNSLSFKELMQLNETPKAVGAPEKAKAKVAGTAAGSVEGGNGTGTGNYEHFLDDSGLCSKPIILPRKKRVYYSGPFV
uniref:Putative gpi-anchored adhesin-like protein pga55 n=2 Tax=Anopheles marajoara TaxID=58244 RepID=A0A2M4B9D4_9DIPT